MGWQRFGTPEYDAAYGSQASGQVDFDGNPLQGQPGASPYGSIPDVIVQMLMQGGWQPGVGSGQVDQDGVPLPENSGLTQQDQLLQRMQQLGISQARDQSGNWAYVDSSGKPIQGTVNTNAPEDSKFMAAALAAAAAVGGGLAAGYGPAGAGTASLGSAGAPLAADAGYLAPMGLEAPISTAGFTAPELGAIGSGGIGTLGGAGAALPESAGLLESVGQVAPLQPMPTLPEFAPWSPSITPSVPSDYSHEGNNYPTPESTQGPGGSPVNATAPLNPLDWLKANPKLAAQLLGGAAGLLGGSGGSGSAPYSGPMPTIQRGGWSPNANPQYMQTKRYGLLSPQPKSNSGLGQYLGLLG